LKLICSEKPEQLHVINRRKLIRALAGGTVVVPFVVDAQPKDKVWKVGYIGFPPRGASAEIDSFIDDFFLRTLAEQGFVEGGNLAFERRAIAGRDDMIPTLVAELIHLRVDVLVTVGTPATRAAKQATATIPIVMAGVADPVERGIVASLARPGGNITGVADFNNLLLPKRFQVLKEAAPGITHAALLYQEDARYFDAAMASAINQRYDAAASELGLKLLRLRLSSPLDFVSAAGMILRERADALVIDATAVNLTLREDIAKFAIRHRLPSVSNSIRLYGTLVSYGPVRSDNYRRAANYVAKIFNGAKPGDLPIEQPRKFELIVDLRMAKAIGLAIPQPLLLRADEVIE
jgi:putative ABC transport system substrate-binding protein